MASDMGCVLDRRAFNILSVGVAISTIGPVVARADLTSDGFTILEAQSGTLRLAPPPAVETAIRGYNGQVPGPLVRIKKGDEVKVRLVNALAQPTSINWHGVRIANAMDGVAGLTQKPVLPGEHFDYRFTPPDAGLYWYHPHVWPLSAEQIGRGLYGVLIVEEPDAPKIDSEMLIVLDDWALDAKAEIKSDALDVATASRDGRIGGLVTLNSKLLPVRETLRPGARVRLRILNACAARICVLGFSELHPTIVAIDGQPSEMFTPMNATVPIGPGSRFDVMVDLSAEISKEAALILRGDDEPDRTLLVLKTEGAPLPGHPPMVKLPANPLLPTRIPLEKSIRRDIVIGGGAGAPDASGSATTANAASPPLKTELFKKPEDPPHPLWLWTINGVASDGFSIKPLFSIARGGAVTLTFVNKTAFPQQMHIHGHVWRLLHDLDDGWDPYWRDSVLLAPGKTKHAAFIADNPGKWTIEALVLDRQITGLATWFEVR